MPTTNANSSYSTAQTTQALTGGTGTYDTVRFNAMKHGILSQHVVLPHEDANAFADLLSALVQEHQPAGVTQTHLVEELAGIMWRKRRVLQAERANFNRGLKDAAQNPRSVIPSAAPFETGLTGKSINLQELLMLTPEEVAERQRETLHDLEATRKAIAILEHGGADAYNKALVVLLPDSRDWWQECVEAKEYPATAEGLTEFIEDYLEPLCLNNAKEAQHHNAIKAQTLGEGLQAYRLEKLNRYETHLDRKFERTLAMLVKLREIRGE